MSIRRNNRGVLKYFGMLMMMLSVTAGFILVMQATSGSAVARAEFRQEFIQLSNDLESATQYYDNVMKEGVIQALSASGIRERDLCPQTVQLVVNEDLLKQRIMEEGTEELERAGNYNSKIEKPAISTSPVFGSDRDYFQVTGQYTTPVAGKNGEVVLLQDVKGYTVRLPRQAPSIPDVTFGPIDFWRGPFVPLGRTIGLNTELQNIGCGGTVEDAIAQFTYTQAARGGVSPITLDQENVGPLGSGEYVAFTKIFTPDVDDVDNTNEVALMADPLNIIDERVGSDDRENNNNPAPITFYITDVNHWYKPDETVSEYWYAIINTSQQGPEYIPPIRAVIANLSFIDSGDDQPTDTVKFEMYGTIDGPVLYERTYNLQEQFDLEFGAQGRRVFYLRPHWYPELQKITHISVTLSSTQASFDLNRAESYMTINPENIPAEVALPEPQLRFRPTSGSVAGEYLFEVIYKDFENQPASVAELQVKDSTNMVYTCDLEESIRTPDECVGNIKCSVANGDQALCNQLTTMGLCDTYTIDKVCLGVGDNPFGNAWLWQSCSILNGPNCRTVENLGISAQHGGCEVDVYEQGTPYQCRFREPAPGTSEGILKYRYKFMDEEDITWLPTEQFCTGLDRNTDEDFKCSIANGNSGLCSKLDADGVCKYDSSNKICVGPGDIGYPPAPAPMTGFDLEVPSWALQVHGTRAVGQPLDISTVIRNDGNGDSPPATIEIFVKSTTGSILHGPVYTQVGPVTAGSTSNRVTTTWTPQNPGSFYNVIACVDVAGDMDVTNNCHTILENIAPTDYCCRVASTTWEWTSATCTWTSFPEGPWSARSCNEAADSDELACDLRCSGTGGGTWVGWPENACICDGGDIAPTTGFDLEMPDGAVQITGIRRINEQLTISAYAVNRGPQGAGATVINAIAISGNINYDFVITDAPISALGAGDQSAIVSGTWTPTVAGTYDIMACVAGGIYTEPDLDNNCHTETITVTSLDLDNWVLRSCADITTESTCIAVQEIPYTTENGGCIVDYTSGPDDENEWMLGPEVINFLPELSTQVTPRSGSLGSSFQFRTIYTDIEGDEPTSVVLTIRNKEYHSITANQVLISGSQLVADGRSYAFAGNGFDLQDLVGSAQVDYRVDFIAQGIPISTDWVSGPFVADTPPLAFAEATPDFGIVAPGKPLTVLFESNSFDIGGSVVQYAWKLYNPEGVLMLERSSEDFTHIFREGDDGAYTAHLTVVDNDGLTDTDSVGVYVDELHGIPVELSGKPLDVTTVFNSYVLGGAPLDVEFRALAGYVEGDDPELYRFIFGDGELFEIDTSDLIVKLEGANAHRYIYPGKQRARVRLTGEVSGITKTSESILVDVRTQEGAPRADVGADQTAILRPGTSTASVILQGDGTDTDGGTIQTCRWRILSAQGLNSGVIENTPFPPGPGGNTYGCQWITFLEPFAPSGKESVYYAELRVRDNDGKWSYADTMKITVETFDGGIIPITGPGIGTPGGGNPITGG